MTKKMQRMRYLLIICVLIIGCGQQDESYYYDEIDPVVYQYDTPDSYIIDDYKDANKTYKGDRNLCWAAAGSNLVASYAKSDENLLFNDIKDNFEDAPNNVCTAIDYFGYTNVALFEYEYFDKFIKFCISNDQPVYISVAKSYTNINHAMTVYGYDTRTSGFFIYITDSNDHRKKLVEKRFDSLDITASLALIKEYTQNEKL